MAEKSGSFKWLWATLMIIVLVIFGPMSLSLLFVMFSGYGGMWSLLGLIPISIVALVIWRLVSLFSKKTNLTNKKDYKLEKHLRPMKIQYLFYIVGVIFVFATVWYFAKEYIAQFPNIIKLILLVVSIVILYVVAEFMRRADI